MVKRSFKIYMNSAFQCTHLFTKYNNQFGLPCDNVENLILTTFWINFPWIIIISTFDRMSFWISEDFPCHHFQRFYHSYKVDNIYNLFTKFQSNNQSSGEARQYGRSMSTSATCMTSLMMDTIPTFTVEESS